jgi:hypothetical protein
MENKLHLILVKSAWVVLSRSVVYVYSDEKEVWFSKGSRV